MSLGSWKGVSFSRALVDSALPGSQEDASLFWTSVSLPANPPSTPTATSQNSRTNHLVTLPVSLPAICRCMGPLHQPCLGGAIRFCPEKDPGVDRNSSARLVVVTQSRRRL